MIELNLLPKELRKKEKKKLPKIKVIPIAAGVVASLVAVHLVLEAVALWDYLALRQMKSKWEGLRPLKEKTDEMSVEITDLEKKIVSIRKIATPPIDWAKILSGLNQAVVPGVWLCEFAPRAGKTGSQDVQPGGSPESLELTGYALGSSEVATATVAKFISNLKKTQEISEYFDEIELNVIDTRTIAGQESVFFKLSCSFKNKGQQSQAGQDERGQKKKKKRK